MLINADHPARHICDYNWRIDSAQLECSLVHESPYHKDALERSYVRGEYYVRALRDMWNPNHFY